jgi:acetyltransferase-like isoleucine patch superfamily enzyme
MFAAHETIIDVKGTLSFLGQCEIGVGSLIRCERNGVIQLGDRVRIGANTKVFCTRMITIGCEVGISWECQIFDTNFHYIKDITTSNIDQRDLPVAIGSRVWIGNRTTIGRGAKIADDCIVASNSYCAKDFSTLPQYSVLAGVPCKTLSARKQRIFEEHGGKSEF